jgi:hypothetical protein
MNVFRSPKLQPREGDPHLAGDVIVAGVAVRTLVVAGALVRGAHHPDDSPVSHRDGDRALAHAPALLRLVDRPVVDVQAVDDYPVRIVEALA